MSFEDGRYEQSLRNEIAAQDGEDKALFCVALSVEHLALAMDRLGYVVERGFFGTQTGPGAYPGAVEMISIAIKEELSSSLESIAGAIDGLEK